MPRIPRGQQGGYAYHVINRGNGRATVFHKAQDYEAFLSLLSEAKKRHRVKIFGFCLMPNHFHLVLERAATGSCDNTFRRRKKVPEWHLAEDISLFAPRYNIAFVARAGFIHNRRVQYRRNRL